MSGVMSTYGKYRVFFSHPDYTVGSGISPDQPPKRVADYNRREGISADADHHNPEEFSFICV